MWSWGWKLELELARFQHQLRAALTHLKLSTAQRVHQVQLEDIARYEVPLGTLSSHTESGPVPGVDESFARAELSSASAAAQVLASKASYDELAAMTRDLVVRAPFEGVVTERNIEQAGYVGPAGEGSSQPMLAVQAVDERVDGAPFEPRGA